MGDEQKPAAAADPQAPVQTVNAQLDPEKLTAEITAKVTEALDAKYKAALAGADRKISELASEKEKLEKAKMDESLSADEKLKRLSDRLDETEKRAAAEKRESERREMVARVDAETAKRGLNPKSYRPDPELSFEDNIKALDEVTESIRADALKIVNEKLPGTPPGSGEAPDTAPAWNDAQHTVAENQAHWIEVEEAALRKRREANAPTMLVTTPLVAQPTPMVGRPPQ